MVSYTGYDMIPIKVIVWVNDDDVDGYEKDDEISNTCECVFLETLPEA